MKISVCIITWNEEKLLPIAVASVQGLADEIVVGDTGSTDRTIEVAKGLGCVVVEGLDRMHKGESRNAVLQAATGDWLIVLDCDEIVADPVGVCAFLEQTDAGALYVRLHFKTAQNATTLQYSQMRIWRKGTYLYKYRAHEIPMPQVTSPKIEYTDFVWEHRPPASRAEGKLKYALDRLVLDVKENPTSSRSKFYLARQYTYMKDWKKSIAMFKKYLRNPDHDQADAYLYLAKCYGEVENETEQIRALHLACAINPGRRDWWGYLGQVYFEKGAYQIALGYFLAALAMPIPKTTYLNSTWYGPEFHTWIARTYYKLGRFKEGLPHAETALELAPDNERYQNNLLWFKSNLGDMDAFYRLHGVNAHANQPRHAELAKRVMGRRVLDFGCGTGDLLLLLSGNGHTLCGVDISGEALKMAEQRGVKAELRTDWPAGKWDTIICSQVLEHLEDPGQWVNEAKGRLAKDGRLLVTVPCENKVPSPDHKTEFTEQLLTELLSSVGDVQIIKWDDPNRILVQVKHG